MSGAKSVRKGKVTERRVAVALRKVFPDAKRSLQFQREHGAGDVEGGPFWVEVKSYDVPTKRTWNAAERERRKAGRREIAALVQPSGGTGPQLITLPLRDLLDLLSGPSAQSARRGTIKVKAKRGRSVRLPEISETERIGYLG